MERYRLPRAEEYIRNSAIYSTRERQIHYGVHVDFVYKSETVRFPKIKFMFFKF